MTDKITQCNAHYRPSRITILVKHMAPYKFVLTVWLMKHWAIKARWKCQYCLRLRFSSTCGLSIHGRDSHWLISCHFMPHCDNFIRRKVANNSKTTLLLLFLYPRKIPYRCLYQKLLLGLLLSIWHQGRHVEIMSKSQNSDSINRYVFTCTTILPNFISIRLEMTEP